MEMTLGRWFLGGIAATAVLTAVLSAAREYRLTRLSFPLLLGTILSTDRQGARRSGWAAHALFGWLFALAYGGIFSALSAATWWIGVVIGVAQAGFVLSVALPALPSWHPRMASPELGATVLRQIEPPGFLAVNYGSHTPEIVILAHALFGAVLGVFFHA